jgi:hypothetical protein
MGGLVWAQDYLETCLLETQNTSWIRREVRKRYDPFGFFTSRTNTDDTTIVSNTVFQQHSTYDITLLGGTESLPISQWRDWIPSTKYEPRPVSYELRPIYTLLERNSTLRYTLEAATLFYRQQAEIDASVYIEHLRVSS